MKLLELPFWYGNALTLCRAWWCQFEVKGFSYELTFLFYGYAPKKKKKLHLTSETKIK